jgi:hypothetical protein
MLFSFVLEYADADDVNLPGEIIDTTKRNTGNLIDASKEVVLEINVEKTICCCLINRRQFVAKFIYNIYTEVTLVMYNCSTPLCYSTRQGQGQGYITTNNQSVSMSWYRAQSRTIDQSLLSP